MGDEPEVSPGGSEIFRHDSPREPEAAPGGWAGQELIEQHVERHLGPIEGRDSSQRTKKRFGLF